MHLLFGQDKVIADWVIKQRGNILPYNAAVGIIDTFGRIRGAATFHVYNGSNIEWCHHGIFSLNRTILKELYDFCFENLKVNRVTITVPRKNKSLIRHLRQFDIKVEGVLRRFYGPYKRDDGVVFGILKSEAEEFFKRHESKPTKPS